MRQGEVETINLFDVITGDCQRQGLQGTLPTGTLVGVTKVRNDCDPKMYFVGTGAEGENGWVSELFLDPTTEVGVAVTPPDSGPPLVAGEASVTDTGLGIIEIIVGEGGTPETGQIIAVLYSGWLSDGSKFDSSLDRATPFEFVLGAGHVIAGWDEGLATMKVGGKRRLIIPANLAYGEQGRPGIPPNAELTFDVELLEIREAP